MFVYFVRHGQSEYNHSGLHQGSDPKLSELGRYQAQYVAEKLKQFPIDLVISSNFTRAMETAAIINGALNKEIIHTDLVREVVWPTELHGRHYQDPEVVKIKELIRSHVDDPKWHYSDEENFSEAVQRASDFFQFLESQTTSHCVVVTHATFLKYIIAVLLYDDTITYELAYALHQFFFVKNTGITIVERNEEGRWRLLTWNDYAHLSELTEE